MEWSRGIWLPGMCPSHASCNQDSQPATTPQRSAAPAVDLTSGLGVMHHHSLASAQRCAAYGQWHPARTSACALHGCRSRQAARTCQQSAASCHRSSCRRWPDAHDSSSTKRLVMACTGSVSPPTTTRAATWTGLRPCHGTTRAVISHSSTPNAYTSEAGDTCVQGTRTRTRVPAQRQGVMTGEAAKGRMPSPSFNAATSVVAMLCFQAPPIPHHVAHVHALHAQIRACMS